MTDEYLIAYGAELKALGENKIGGYLVRFSSAAEPDLTGDFFTPETDFDLLDGVKSVPVLYQHGMDSTLKKRKLGRATLRVDDVGVWMEAQLNLRDEYEKAVYDLVESGKMGLSSGSVTHLVERTPAGKAYHITSWPIAEASITPHPAEPRTSVMPLKSLYTAIPEATPEAAQAEVVAVDADKAPQITLGESNMTDEVKAVNQPDLTAFEQRMAELSAKIDAAVKHIEEEPAIRKAGYYTVDGGKADQNVKSFGDFLLAMTRRDDTRLESIYGATKTLSEGSGTAGGYLIPPQIENALMKFVDQQSQVLPRVTHMSVSSNDGAMPYFDIFNAPTAGVGDSAFAAGVKPTKRKESGSYTETEMSFDMMKWLVSSAGGYTRVTKELASDAPGIESYLTRLITASVSAKLEYWILRGTGVGEPLGILTSAAAIGVTPNTNNSVKWVDVLTMKSQFVNLSGGQPVWVMHPGIWQDIGVMEVSTGSGGVFQSNLGSGLGNALLGYPMVESQHAPNPDTAGAIGLYDLGSYYLFERGGLEIAYSEHDAFTSGLVTWRFDKRVDGKPAVKSYITLASPTAFTVSPFVYHND